MLDKKIPFEAANVAPDIAVWTRFWVLISLYFWNIFNGILAIIIANSAPMMDVFVLIPNLAINSRPMIEPITETKIFNNIIAGSHADGCFLFINFLLSFVMQ